MGASEFVDDAITGPHETCRESGFSGVESHVLELFPRMSSGDVPDESVEVIGKLAKSQRPILINKFNNSSLL